MFGAIYDKTNMISIYFVSVVVGGRLGRSLRQGRAADLWAMLIAAQTLLYYLI